MKTVTFQKPKKVKLVHWNERLQRGNIKSRQEQTFQQDKSTVRAISWVLSVGNQIRLLTALDVLQGSIQLKSSHLVITDYGYICPNCGTNEFIHSQIEWLPLSLQDAARRFGSNKFGLYCRRCGCISPAK